MRKDDRTVGKGALVHEREAFFKVLDALDAEHRPEDFAAADAHFRRYVVKDGMSEIKAVFIAGHGDAAPVEYEFRALADARLNPVEHALLVLRRDHGAEVGRFVVSGSDLFAFDLLEQFAHQLVGNALHGHDDRQRHAALARAAERGV
ncbi:hypothetical protein SDC9_98486 [bioreactor metagenome]|uniref:Uncharacterized protein n=1 Tax=bioreactor metagenome TaxID=1076179 RepID=A0A645AEU9_9ZZZZ